MTIRDTAPAAILIALVVSTWGLIFSVSQARAELSTPVQYQFTMTKIELCKSSACSSPTLLGQGSQAYDIGATQATPGQSVGNFITDFSLAPNQTFTHLRVTMNRAFDITSTAPTENSGDTNDCVTGAGGNIVTASATNEARSEVTTGSVAASQVITVPDTTANHAPGNLATLYATEGIALVDATTMTVTFLLTSSFTTGDKVPNFDVAFDVADTIEFIQASASTCFVILNPPSVTISIN